MPSRWVTAALLMLALTATAPGARVGIEMPAAGDDGGEGLAVSAAIRLGLGAARVVARDSASGGVLNPHQDEGTDNDVDRRRAPAIVAGFAADRSIVAAVGGLRRSVGDADAVAAEAHGLPLIVLARWSRGARSANAFCLCASPPRLAAFARATARARFGPRLLVVLFGEAAALPAEWPGRFRDPLVAVADTPASVAAAQRRALGADSVLVLADERPATLWRGSAFRHGFDRAYLQALGHRDFHLVPAGTARGDVVVLGEALPRDAARRAFDRLFHAGAGFMPGEQAVRGYAAGQIVRAAGSDRGAIRAALAHGRFATAAGPVRFDPDGYRAGGALAAAVP